MSKKIKESKGGTETETIPPVSLRDETAARSVAGTTVALRLAGLLAASGRWFEMTRQAGDRYTFQVGAESTRLLAKLAADAETEPSLDDLVARAAAKLAPAGSGPPPNPRQFAKIIGTSDNQILVVIKHDQDKVASEIEISWMSRVPGLALCSSTSQFTPNRKRDQAATSQHAQKEFFDLTEEHARNKVNEIEAQHAEAFAAVASKYDDDDDDSEIEHEVP